MLKRQTVTDQRAISLHAPWAQWVVLGWKLIETRKHDRFKSLIGQRIFIHSAKFFDKTALAAAYPFMDSLQIGMSKNRNPRDIYRPGHVIGSVDVVAGRWLKEVHNHDAMIECGGSVRRFGIFLSNARLFANPFPVVGRQGIFTIKGSKIVTYREKGKFESANKFIPFVK